ncbi:nucleoside phosphorylase domain-containing protein [Aspergillus pseudocaelatus]|uniref:Nucleoside phosphorylase domain-containing protein n=1 Tax=Aspergillus pseudocaelatus TaxID=1825620 RepID=A0ABQ6WRW2_9EURO|nr:nucleoside phosphorylase domain-containing protein [Aspergillus pseudocaelatus]
MKASPYPNDEYTVGWISALNEELMVAMAMLDEEHGRPQSTLRDDTNACHLGKIGEHNVAMACLSGGQMGTGPAAIVAENMRRTFKNIRFAFLLSYWTYTGIVQYDYGKLKNNGHVQRKDWFCAPPRKILAAVDLLKAYHARPKKPVNNMMSIVEELGEEYAYPEEDVALDLLYQADYEHGPEAEACDFCDRKALIPRNTRKLQYRPYVHYGIIASGNMVIKSGIERDKIDQRYENSMFCFEMEAAVLMNKFPCLVIRGISDYSDSHKNDQWRKRAIAVASAYAKELLLLIEPSDVELLTPIVARVLDTVSQNIRKIDESTASNTTLLKKAAEETRLRRQQDLQMRCERWLKPPYVRETQQDQIRKRLLGTYEIWSNPIFSRWKAAPLISAPDRLMCIHGPPGCGKSILASSIVDCMWNDNVSALFFAFSGMHASQLKSSGLIRSLLWQLVEIAPEEQAISILHDLMLRGQPTTSDRWIAFDTIAALVSKPVY